MHPEGGSTVGFCRGGEILAEKIFGEFRGEMGGSEDAGGIDQGGVFAVVGVDAGLERGEDLVGLIVALVEVAEVDGGAGSFAGFDGGFELGFGGGEVFILFGD